MGVIFSLIALSLFFLPTTSAEEFGYNFLKPGTDLTSGTNYSTVEVNSSNFTDKWITSNGILDNVGDILTSWLTNNAFLELLGGTMQGAIDMNSNNILMNQGNITDVSILNFNESICTSTDNLVEGDVCWNPDDYTLNIVTGKGTVLQVNQETVGIGINKEGETLPDGTIVTTANFQGDRMTFIRADNTNASKSGMVGILTQSCENNAECFITVFGQVRGLNTSGFTSGEKLYIDSTQPGNFTNIIPTLPNNPIWVATAIVIHEQQGTIFVNPSIDPADGFLINSIWATENITADWFKGRFNWTTGDTWNSFDGSTLLFNESKLDPFILGLGYNHTENLTIFYDERYLTGELALYFYNGTSPLNSSYTIMNTTIPTGLEQRDSFENLVDGDNLLTKRILSGLNITILERGAYNQHTTIDYIAGTKDVSMRSELYILYENGTEVMIGTSPPSIGLIVGTYQQIIWTGVINNDIIFPEGSHLTMYLYATVSGVGGAPDLDLVVGADTAARLDIGINPTDIKTIEVDPFAFHKDGSTPMQGNANISGFNLSNIDWINGFNQINGSGNFKTTGGKIIAQGTSPWNPKLEIYHNGLEGVINNSFGDLDIFSNEAVFSGDVFSYGTLQGNRIFDSTLLIQDGSITNGINASFSGKATVGSLEVTDIDVEIGDSDVTGIQYTTAPSGVPRLVPNWLNIVHVMEQEGGIFLTQTDSAAAQMFFSNAIDGAINYMTFTYDDSTDYLRLRYSSGLMADNYFRVEMPITIPLDDNAFSIGADPTDLQISSDDTYGNITARDGININAPFVNMSGHLNVTGNINITQPARQFSFSNPIIDVTAEANAVSVIGNIMSFDFTHSATGGILYTLDSALTYNHDITTTQGGLTGVQITHDSTAGIEATQPTYTYGYSNIINDFPRVKDDTISNSAFLYGNYDTILHTTGGNGTYNINGIDLRAGVFGVTSGTIIRNSYGVKLTGWGVDTLEVGGTSTDDVGAIYSDGGDWVMDSDNNYIKIGATDTDLQISSDGTYGNITALSGININSPFVNFNNNITADRYLAEDGSLTSPAYAFTDNPDMGLYAASHSMSFSINGVKGSEFDAYGILTSDGSDTAPSYTFFEDTDSGWGRKGIDNVRLILNRVEVIDYNTTYVNFTDLNLMTTGKLGVTATPTADQQVYLLGATGSLGTTAASGGLGKSIRLEGGFGGDQNFGFDFGGGNTISIGGLGGEVRVKSGEGGRITAKGTIFNNGGAAGDFVFLAGNGGSVDFEAASALTATAGAGGDFQLEGGIGAGWGGSSQTTGTFTTGAGGNLVLKGGRSANNIAGSAGSTTQADTGDGGSLHLSGGSAGTADDTQGADGVITLGDGGTTNYIEIDNTGILKPIGSAYFHNTDNIKSYFGTLLTDLEISSDGTNPIFNTTGVFEFYNGSGLGKIRVADIVYSTPEFETSTSSKLKTMKDPKLITRDDKTEEQFHQAFPEAVKEYITVKDKNSCSQVLDFLEYCYTIENKTGENFELCRENQVEKWKDYNEILGEEIKEHYREECETKQELVISGGKGYLDNYGLLYELKEENDLLKSELCKKDNTYSWCVTVELG